MTETRLSPVTGFKAEDVKGNGEFTGYAATFNDAPDSYGDVIAPGAFDATLSRHRARRSMPAMLWAHDTASPIGKWLTLQENDKGLLATGRLTLGTQKADEAYALLKDGALNGLSVGYSVPVGGSENLQSTRLLKEIDLHEISLVTIPANSSALITSVKDRFRGTTIRDLERSLRETFGLSHREAKSVAAELGGYLGLNPGEPFYDPVEISAVSEQFKKLNSLFERK